VDPLDFCCRFSPLHLLFNMVQHEHGHGDEADHGHDHAGHSHGVVDPSITTSERGLWAVKWSGIILIGIALLELVVVTLSHSTALLADMIHNFGDAATVIPLWIAFALMRRAPRQRFPFGYGRVEDLAGVLIVAVLIANALFAGYEAVTRIIRPEPITHLWIVAAMSLISFVGNEGIAILRIKVGREIGSAALIADGRHARVDGWTALAVLLGAIGVWFGFPLADPIMGLVITAAILGVVWASAKTIFTRILDGVEPGVIDDLRHAALDVSGVQDVTDVRARWIGHRLYAEANVIVSQELTVGDGHKIAAAVQHQLIRHVPHVETALIHICPDDSTGAEHHAVDAECTECEP
jgi:cation diffusion facilitator family transporter